MNFLRRREIIPGVHCQTMLRIRVLLAELVVRQEQRCEAVPKQEQDERMPDGQP